MILINDISIRMVKCAECGQVLKSTQALASHMRNVHGLKSEDLVETDESILNLKKEVKKAELSARLQRLKASMEGGKSDLLFLELDRLGRVAERLQTENEALRKDNEAIRSTMLTSDSIGSVRGMILTLSDMLADVNLELVEHNKLLGQLMVLEGWRLNHNSWGFYNLKGLGDQRLAYLVREGKIVLNYPQPYAQY